MATFYNQATLSYNGNVASSNITTGNIREVITAEKSAVINTYTPDNDVVFIISIVNSGSTDISDVTVTDNLGEYEFGDPAQSVVPLTYEEGSVTYYVNGVQQADPEITSASPLTITGLSIPAGGNALVIYAARPNQFAPLAADGSITNTAVISGAGSEDVTVSETITPSASADLAISKSLSPTEVEENGAVTYTFIIQNFGNTEAGAADDVIFRDTFAPALTSLAAQYNGAAWAEGTNYTYDEATGEFESLPGQITIPAAEFVQDASGAWSVQPGVRTLTITGNIA